MDLLHSVPSTSAAYGFAEMNHVNAAGGSLTRQPDIESGQAHFKGTEFDRPAWPTSII
jgi:hypothetical protein